MKFKFLVEYDTDLKQFFVDCNDSKTWLKHSGSSYLRIKRRGELYQYGTIGGHGGPFPSEGPPTQSYLSFAIDHNLPEILPETEEYGFIPSSNVPPFIDEKAELLDKLKLMSDWVDAALKCEEWRWDGDQKEAAQWSLDEALKVIKEYEDDNR